MASPAFAKGGSSERTRSSAEDFGVRHGGERLKDQEAPSRAEECARAFGQASPVCHRLRAVFGGVASEPVPDQLEALARRLEAALERGEGPFHPA
jgi:hypothetical protein